MRVVVLTAAIITMAQTTYANAHGGGCKKSSSPGQCCHIDNSAGRVHCH